jgi:hypothetical protein
MLRLSGPPDRAMGWARAACMLPLGGERAIDLVALTLALALAPALAPTLALALTLTLALTLAPTR